MTEMRTGSEEGAPVDVKSHSSDTGGCQPDVPVPALIQSSASCPSDKVVITDPTSKTAPATPRPASTAVTVVAASSRAAKSKKKKGSSTGAAGPGGAGENTGRWTAEEHRLFLQGLEQHGKGWKKIASLIKSRTVVQIRTHAQKYFQKLAKARQNGEEGEVAMEGRGGISTLSSTTSTGGQNTKRRRQQTGSKRKGIHSVVSSAQREGKRIASEQEKSGVPNPVAPLPAISPVLANFVLPEVFDQSSTVNRCSLASSTTTTQGTISGPALEDSIFRFLTPTPVTGSDASLSDVARQAGANPITLPTHQPSSAPTVGGEISPTGVADTNLYPSWTDGKDPPSWYAKGADVEALLDVADTLDWLADSGDPQESYKPVEPLSAEPSVVHHVGKNAEDDPHLLETSVLESEVEVSDTLPAAPQPAVCATAEEVNGLEASSLSQESTVDIEKLNKHAEQQLPSIFDGAPDESSEHIPEGKGMIQVSESVVHLEAESHAAIEESLFESPAEENDFVATILENENESSVDLPVLEG